MRGLALAKAYHPTFDPAPLIKGFPQFNADGSTFDKKSYSRVVKQTRYAASQIANSLKLITFQNGYDEDGQEIIEEGPPRVDLLQSYGNAQAQQDGAPSSSTPNIIPPTRANTEDEDPELFESLVSVTWRAEASP